MHQSIKSWTKSLLDYGIFNDIPLWLIDYLLNISNANKSLQSYLAILDRFDELNLRYLKNTFENRNEIIMELYKDYRENSDSRELRRKSLFCNYKNQLIIQWSKYIHEKIISIVKLYFTLVYVIFM